MSKVLEQATAHFRNKVGGEMKFIHVPEWSSKIWFKPSITLKEQSKLIGESSFEMHEGRRAFRDLSTSVADWEEIS